MRRAALLLVVLLVAASCGSDEDPAVSDSAVTTTVAGGDPGATAASGGETPAVTTPSGETVTTIATSTPAPPDTTGPPGSAATYYLRPAPATGLLLEVSVEAGAEPSGSTIDHVASVLGQVAGKPVERSGGNAVPGREAWTAADLRAAADAAAVVAQGDAGRAVVRLLYVRGRYADADGVLGVVVRGDVAVVFSDSVAASSTPLIGAGAIETAVSMHEVGHLLGLVDLHLDTGREDPEHPGHSTNRGSVMYWAVESSLVSDLLTGGPPRNFDDADLADLAAIRDGG